MLETIVDITSGEALLDGMTVATDLNTIKAIIGVQPQTANFEEKTTLAELLRIFASFYGESVDPMQLLKKVIWRRRRIVILNSFQVVRDSAFQLLLHSSTTRRYSF